MACATLKRNLDWESMAQLPAKRRRCAPFPTSSSPSTSPGIKVSENKALFGESGPATAKLTPERVLQELYDQMKRLQRRRQLRLASGGASCSSSSGSEGDCSPPHRSSHTSHKVHNSALFTFKQLRMICERMLHEQEVALRAEYETALRNKLDEQYQAFVRFNLDQVQRQPPPTCAQLSTDDHHMHQDLVPSYLS